MTAFCKPTATKVTIQYLQSKKERGEPITMLTAYDYPTALALDRAGVDAILVGDSLGMVVLGYETTLPVTMEDMLHHCKAVARGAVRAHLVGDMPFMSYQCSASDAVRNAGRFLQEAGMDAVKLEGGRERAAAIEAIFSAGIPVMGHLGLTPQSVRRLGGWKTQARSTSAALRLVEDADILQKRRLLRAGARGRSRPCRPARPRPRRYPGDRDRGGWAPAMDRCWLPTTSWDCLTVSRRDLSGSTKTCTPG